MVSKNDITKERRKELLKRAKDLGESMKIAIGFPEDVSVKVTEQKWGICVGFDIDDHDNPIRWDLSAHIDYDVSDEQLGAIELIYAQYVVEKLGG